MDNLRITLVQSSLQWESPASNFAHFQEILSDTVQTDVIVLPEMFSTGFSMDPAKNFDKDNEALSWMKYMAAKKQAAFCGSVIVKEEEQFFNRLYFVFPNGEYKHYDKRHLFTLAGEQKIYSSGKNRLLVKYKGWSILPFVCYDLRFPVWTRNTEEAELMLFVANWPERRSEAWKTLLKARAIENMCFVAGVNRIGDDGNNIYHSGDTSLFNEVGELISNIKAGEESVKTYTLNKLKVLDSRNRFNFLNDRDSFSID